MKRRLLGATFGAIAAVVACVGDDPLTTPEIPDAASDAPQTGDDGGGGDDAGDAGPPVPTGAFRWVKQVFAPPNGFVSMTSVAITPQDEVFAAGVIQSNAGTLTFDFGNGKTLQATNTNGIEGFIAKYDASGACAWVLLASGVGTDLPIGIAVGPSGEVVMIAQTNSAAVTIASTPVGRPANAGGQDLLLVKIQGNGMLAFHRIYGGPGTDEPGAVAVNKNGDIAIGAAFVRANGADNISFAPISVAWPPSPADVAAVILLDGAGAGKWGRALPQTAPGVGTDRNTVRTIAFDSKGDVLAGGDFAPSIKFRDGSDPPIDFATAGGEDAWFAKLAGTNGRTSWAQKIGGTGQDRTTGITVDAMDNVLVAGTYFAPGPIMIGSTNMPIFGGADVFIAKADPAGSMYQWARGFGGPQFQNVSGLATDPWGRIVVTGRQGESVTWAGKATTGGGGGNDGYVVKVSDDALTGHWAYGLGSSGNDDAFALGISRTTGRTAIAGSLAGAATLAGQPVGPDGGTGSYGYVLVLDQ